MKVINICTWYFICVYLISNLNEVLPVTEYQKPRILDQGPRTKNQEPRTKQVLDMQQKYLLWTAEKKNHENEINISEQLVRKQKRPRLSTYPSDLNEDSKRITEVSNVGRGKLKI